MDPLAAYLEVASYRGAAVMCGTTHKTALHIIEAHEASSTVQSWPPRVDPDHSCDSVRPLVTDRAAGRAARISAKRYPGADAASENFDFRNSGVTASTQLGLR